MNKLIIIGYMAKLKKEDIKAFSLKENIDIKNKEIDIIYDYIKNEPKRIIDNPLEVIEEIKDKVSIQVYDKILELYFQYKDKIS